jgi:hypothetical protein
MMFLMCVVLCVLAVGLDAAPVMNEKVRLEQPDGTVIYAFQTGDEFYSRVHDENGFTIIRDPNTGYWSLAVECGIRLGDIESSGYSIHHRTAQSMGMVEIYE